MSEDLVGLGENRVPFLMGNEIAWPAMLLDQPRPDNPGRIRYCFFFSFGMWDLFFLSNNFEIVDSQILGQNHLEERLLDQAQARAAYTPLFWGHSRSIPQGMILDVQPLVKSLFCPIRPSPNGFFDFEASTP